MLSESRRQAIRQLYDAHGDPADVANCVPELLAALTEAERQRDRLREALENICNDARPIHALADNVNALLIQQAWSVLAGTAQEVKKLELRVETKRGIPAFAGYLAGSVKTGRVRILLNIDALLWSCVDAGERGDFRRATIDCIAHEFIHALEEHFGLLFDEEAVEASIERVRASKHRRDSTTQKAARRGGSQ